ncbi:MAG: hypothetical protein IH899_01480 [Planctomycetes bacterium]|nr:hypothetical protein [Planctomycetota bacterium]
MTATQIRGESEAARFVEGQIADQHRFLHKSAALGIEQVLREELVDVWEECSQPDWDAYNALPVTWDTYENARRLLLAFPLGTPLPSLGAEPDGHITLEWHCAPRRTLSVSITPDELLHYAALLGPGRTCGTEPFFGEVPQRILDLIRDVYTC